MYRIEWLPAAAMELVRLYRDASPEAQAALSLALDSLERDLSTEPHKAGESRVWPSRVLFAPPLAVLFVADFRRQVVTMISVWRIPERTSP